MIKLWTTTEPWQGRLLCATNVNSSIINNNGNDHDFVENFNSFRETYGLQGGKNGVSLIHMQPISSKYYRLQLKCINERT